jgi:hypothetical protein
MSDLHTATVTATEAQAAAIEAKLPTAEEMAATDAAQDAALDAAVSLEDYTTRVVVVAIGAHDRATFNGVSAVALRLCMKQARVNAIALIDPQTDEFVFNSIYFDAALSGKVIFRNTKDTTDSADKVAEIVAARDAGDMNKARSLAAEYVMKFGKGRKLTKGLALLRQDGMRLATYMRDNNAALINTCAAMVKDKGEHKLCAQTWRKSVLSTFGDTFAAMSDKLETLYANPNKGKGAAKGGNKGATKAKEAETVAPEAVAAAENAPAAPFHLSNDATDADRIKAIFDIVEGLSAFGFDSLVQRINAEAASRAAMEAAGEAARKAREAAETVDAEFSEVSETVEADAAPLALPAPVVVVRKARKGAARKAA